MVSTNISHIRGRLDAVEARQSAAAPVDIEVLEAITTDTVIIPERYQISAEDRNRWVDSGIFPGNFCLRLTERLFPELFGPEALRQGYNYNGASNSKYPKKQLDPIRKQAIVHYVQSHYRIYLYIARSHALRAEQILTKKWGKNLVLVYNAHPKKFLKITGP
ncbi:MAG: hypothetical protein ABW185_15945 [Sedimenticola sp.]